MITPTSPFIQYMGFLNDAKEAANSGNIELAKLKIKEYKKTRQEIEYDFQKEIEYYAESDRGITHFIFDKRCLSICLLEELMNLENEINKKLKEGATK
jgi:hypothetical protein